MTSHVGSGHDAPPYADQLSATSLKLHACELTCWATLCTWFRTIAEKDSMTPYSNFDIHSQSKSTNWNAQCVRLESLSYMILAAFSKSKYNPCKENYDFPFWIRAFLHEGTFWFFCLCDKVIYLKKKGFQ